MANHAIRAAIQVETEPSTVSAYLRFLATHTKDDSVQEQSGLVSDLAQVCLYSFMKRYVDFYHYYSVLSLSSCIMYDICRVFHLSALLLVTRFRHRTSTENSRVGSCTMIRHKLYIYELSISHIPVLMQELFMSTRERNLYRVSVWLKHKSFI